MDQHAWMDIRFREARESAKSSLLLSGCPDYQWDDAIDDWTYENMARRLERAISTH